MTGIHNKDRQSAHSPSTHRAVCIMLNFTKSLSTVGGYEEPGGEGRTVGLIHELCHHVVDVGLDFNFDAILPHYVGGLGLCT